MVFSSRTLGLSALALVAVAAVALFLYAWYDYANSACYADMRKAGLDKETAELFDSVGDIVTGLRKGAGDTPKWDSREFQDEIKDASHILVDGRRALKNRNAFAALKSVGALRKSMARAKSMATNQVNFILQRQDPADYDAFEKYRLEGKQLVEIVKRTDWALEALSNRKLPEKCEW